MAVSQEVNATPEIPPKRSPEAVSAWLQQWPAQDAPPPEGIEFERHFKVNQIAKIWGFSRETIRRLFKDEPGVIRLGRTESRFRRGYQSLSIPESVMRSVHRRLRRATGRSA